MAKILIADDERAICEAFSDLLRGEGHTPLIASSGEQALELMEQETPEVVFLDVQMPNMNGLTALGDISTHHPEVPVIVMTAYGTIHTAMEAMRLGAFDYLGKPVELPQIRTLLERALHRPQADSAADMEIADSGDPSGQNQLIGNSPVMQEIFKLMGLLTTNDLTVLLTGESGVGKELVARGIHAHGLHKDRPFVAVNCAAIPEQLIESELFGHEKGSFTGAEERRIGRFEAAADGTLFLDEISELPYHLQSKLLRVLQEKSFERIGSVKTIPLKARIIAATNRDLQEASSDPHPFRKDLYHRLNLVNLNIPPLRERREDIDCLARQFLSRANTELAKQIKGIEPAALARLQRHDWPGNVRELEHTIKRSALIARGDLLTVHDLTFESSARARTKGTQQDNALNQLRSAARTALQACIDDQSDNDALFQRLIIDTEQTLIEEALRITNGNQVAASRLLGLHRTTLRKKMG